MLNYQRVLSLTVGNLLPRIRNLGNLGTAWHCSTVDAKLSPSVYICETSLTTILGRHLSQNPCAILLDGDLTWPCFCCAYNVISLHTVDGCEILHHLGWLKPYEKNHLNQLGAGFRKHPLYLYHSWPRGQQLLEIKTSLDPAGAPNSGRFLEHQLAGGFDPLGINITWNHQPANHWRK